MEFATCGIEGFFVERSGNDWASHGLILRHIFWQGTDDGHSEADPQTCSSGVIVFIRSFQPKY